jgi:hypothetical protein
MNRDLRETHAEIRNKRSVWAKVGADKTNLASWSFACSNQSETLSIEIRIFDSKHNQTTGIQREKRFNLIYSSEIANKKGDEPETFAITRFVLSPMSTILIVPFTELNPFAKLDTMPLLSGSPVPVSCSTNLSRLV